MSVGLNRKLGTRCGRVSQRLTRRTPGRTVSIVVPCLNEEAVIGEFIDWCREGLRKAGREGQILIIDSSSDRSPEIARQRGAEGLNRSQAWPGPSLHRRHPCHYR